MCCVLPEHSTKEPPYSALNSAYRVSIKLLLHVHIIGHNYSWLFICLTESEEGSTNVGGKTADWDQPLTFLLWSEPWRHLPSSCLLKPLFWQESSLEVQSSDVWSMMMWQQCLTWCLVWLMCPHQHQPRTLTCPKQPIYTWRGQVIIFF